MTILVATPQYLMRHGAPESPDDLNRFRAVVFVERDSVQPWSFGSGPGAERVIPTGVFRTSDIEQMRMGVLEHLGIAQAPAWLFAAELRDGTVIHLLTPLERTVPILAVRPASRRLSALSVQAEETVENGGFGDLEIWQSQDRFGYATLIFAG